MKHHIHLLIILSVIVNSLIAPLLSRAATTAELLAQTIPRIEEAALAVSKIKSGDADRVRWLNDQVGILRTTAADVQNDLAWNTPRSVANATIALGDIDYMIGHMREDMAALSRLFAPGPRLSVRDFGARADGGDDGPAIAAGIRALAKTPNSTLFFPKGKYYLRTLMTTDDVPFAHIPAAPGIAQHYQTHAAKLRAHLLLYRLAHATLEGEEGTELIMANPLETGIHLCQCEAVTLKHIVIDYDPLPFWQGTITKIARPNLLEVVLDKGFPPPTASFFKTANHPRARVNLAASSGAGREIRLTAVAPGGTGFEAIETMRDDSCRFKISGAKEWDIRKLANGMQVVFFARMGSSHAVKFDASRRCTADHVTVFASPAMAFEAGASESLVIRDCAVTARPGTGRLYSTAADDLYFTMNTFGSLVTRSSFRDSGDDFLNIHTLARPAHSVDGSVLYMPMAFWPPALVRPGFRIGVLRTSAARGDIGSAHRIAAVELARIGGFSLRGIDCYKLTLAEPIAGLVTLATVGKGKSPDNLIILESLSHGFVVERNEFSRGYSRMLLGGRNGIFRNNTVADILMVPRFMCVGPERLGGHGGEWNAPCNIAIVGNTFTSARNKPIIRFQTGTFMGKPSTENDIIHIRITGNVFRTDKHAGLPFITLANVDDVQIAGNTYLCGSAPDAVAARLDQGARVAFKDNVIESKTPEPFVFGEHASKNAANISGNRTQAH
ncbi:MAG: hypothetical protein WCV00_23495 [Verrucomicrobiia bacterium]